MPHLKQVVHDIPLEESQKTVKKNYLKPQIINKNEFNHLLLLDPTRKKSAKYFDWIVEEYVNERDRDFKSFGDKKKFIKTLRKAISDFYTAAERNKLSGKEKEITQYHSLKQLLHVTEEKGSFKEVGGKKIDLSGLTEKDYKIMYESDKGAIIQINTMKASVKLGSDTWCIAKKDPEGNAFDSMSSGGAFFFDILNLAKSNEKRNKVWNLAIIAQNLLQYIPSSDPDNAEDYIANQMENVYEVTDGLNDSSTAVRTEGGKLITSEAFLDFLRSANIPPQEIIKLEATITIKEEVKVKAFMQAAREGRLPVLEKLLNDGIDVNVQDADGDTALIQASWDGNPATVKFLLDKGADVNAENNNGYTALIWASFYGRTEVVKLLLDKGADINAKDKYGYTALIWASRNGHTEIVKVLLNAGADINAKNNDGETALIQASWDGNSATVKFLLDKGADVNVKSKYGNTAFMKASQNGRTEIVKVLLNAGADINAKNNAGETALMFASFYGRTEIIKLLLDKGADVTVKSKYGNTAFMKASQNGHTEIVKVLLNAGADINAKNNAGETALMKASFYGYTEVVKLLKQHKAKAESLTDDVLEESKAEAKAKKLAWIKENYVDLKLITPKEYDNLLLLDPTHKKTAGYFDWLVSEYSIEKNDKDFKTYGGQKEFVQELRNAIKGYHYLVGRNVVKVKLKNINSLKELQKIVKQHSSSEEKPQKQKKRSLEEKFDGLTEFKDYNIVYVSNGGMIVHLRSKQAAIQLGNSPWCISKSGKEEDKNMWGWYEERRITTYVFLPKDEELLKSEENKVWGYAMEPSGVVQEINDAKNTPRSSHDLLIFCKKIQIPEKVVDELRPYDPIEDLRQALNDKNMERKRYIINNASSEEEQQKLIAAAEIFQSPTPLLSAFKQKDDRVAALLVEKSDKETLGTLHTEFGGIELEHYLLSHNMTETAYALDVAGELQRQVFHNHPHMVTALVEKAIMANNSNYLSGFASKLTKFDFSKITVGEENEDPISFAVRLGLRSDVVSQLILGLGLRVSAEKGNYLFVRAAEKRDGATALVLLDYFPSLVKESPSNRLIGAAAKSGDLELTKKVLSVVEIDSDDDLDLALVEASHAGSTDIVSLLLDKGADVNAQDADGYTALSIASRNGHTEVVKLLLDKGADVNVQDADGDTALIWASRNGHTEVVKLLLDKGADINAKDKYGDTALILASRKGHTEIVKVLLNAGADINAKDGNDWTALMLASFYGHTEIVKVLLNAGADINAKYNAGNTALILASEKGHTEIVELLKQYGAKEESLSEDVLEESKADVLARNLTSVKENYLDTEMIDKKAYDGLLKIDPTRNKVAAYFNWIVSEYVNARDMKYKPWKNRHEFIISLGRTLRKYHKLKGDNVIKDKIDTYSNLTKLMQAIDRVEAGMKQHSEESFTSKFKGLKEGIDYDIIDQSDKGMIAWLGTQKGVDQLGSDTWCISKARHKYSDWKKYVEREKAVFVILNKDTSSKMSGVWGMAVYTSRDYHGRTRTTEIKDGLNVGQPYPMLEQFTKELGLSLKKIEQYPHYAGIGPTIVYLIKSKDFNGMKKMLQAGLDPNEEYPGMPDSESILGLAVLYGGLNIVALLLKFGARANVERIYHQPILNAYHSGPDISMIKLLLGAKGRLTPNKIDVDARVDGAPLLGKVVASSAVVKIFVKHGVNVNVTDRLGRTPLIHAADGGYDKSVKLLLGAGSNINAKDADGYTALIRAAKRGHVGAVRLLLAKKANVVAKKANVDIQEKDGDTALIKAARFKYLEIVKLLLDNGASFSIKNREGDTALDLVPSKHQDIIDLLKKHGAKYEPVIKTIWSEDKGGNNA